MATTDDLRDMSLASRAVHAGERLPHPDFTPTATPIYQSTSYTYDDAIRLGHIVGGEEKGYVYSRTGNPTVRAFEAAVAAVENAGAAIATASGMAALHIAILHGVRAGSKIVAAHDLYGATTVLLASTFEALDIHTTFVDMLDIAAVTDAIASNQPDLVILETISNPLMRVPDLPRIAAIAHTHRARVLVDNTFCTPVLINPLEHGADVVVHSSTKYFGGHADVTGGVIVTDEDTGPEINSLVKLTGAVLGPFEAWLTMRGLKTLPLRFERQCRTAATIATWLAADPRVASVNYPGLQSSEHGFAHFRSDLRGAMVSFEMRDATLESAMTFLNGLRMWVPASSLGDVYSLAVSPFEVTHRTVDPELLAEAGITQGLIRLSVGIEDPADLIADLDRTLALATGIAR